MSLHLGISGFVALYIFMLAAFAGWVIIGRVPAILHTPLMSGSNFVHGIVVVGGVYALLNASTVQQQVIGFVAVFLGAGNAAGGYAVTDRMLAMFKSSGHDAAPGGHGKAGKVKSIRAGSGSAKLGGAKTGSARASRAKTGSAKPNGAKAGGAK